MIDDTEREDYLRTILDNGMDPHDFELLEERDEPAGVEYAVTGTVTVRRKSTNTERSYPAGHGTAWAVDFADDLSNGLFD